MSEDLYAKYSLDSDDFNVSLTPDRITSSSLFEEYSTWLGQFTDRRFLVQPLTSDQYSRIMPTETLAGAEKAELFQARVADIIINESFESLINLETLGSVATINWKFSSIPYHESCGEWAGKKRLFWVRKSLGDSLVELSEVLRHLGLGIRFEDAFRPTGVQEGLFRRRYEMAKQENPTYSHEELLLEARSKTAYTPRFAAHKAGAAVDVRLYDIESNTLLDIGHNYPDGGEIVRLETPFVTQAVWENRKILEFAAQKVGLSMYPFEDWHLCLNDATAAVMNSGTRVALYGPIKAFGDDGTVLKTYSQEELDEVFSILPADNNE